MNVALQVFIYIDVFVIGALFSVAIRHAYAHFRPAKVEPKHGPVPTNQAKLPDAVKEKLLAKSEEQFAHVLDKSSHQLEQDLTSTAERINVTIKKLAADIITKELQDMKDMLSGYKQQTENEISQTRQDTDKYREDLKRHVNEDIETEKQQRLHHERHDNVIEFIVNDG